MFAKVKSTSGQSFVFIFVIYCRNFSTLMTFLSNTHHGDYTIIISDLPTLLWHKWNCAVSVVGWLVTASGCWSQLGDYCTSAINTNSSGWVAGGTKANKFHANWQIHSLDGRGDLFADKPTNQLLMAVSEKMSHLSWDHLTVIRTSNYSWPLPPHQPPQFKT